MTAEDLTAGFSDIERALAEARLKSISPDDGKYAKESAALVPYLSAHAEWLGCVRVQEVLLETRIEFGQAPLHSLVELRAAIQKIDPLNISLLEEKVTRHDQLAVLEEIGRHVSEGTKALLHPGTTSYDILDTARAYLYKGAWFDVMQPAVCKTIGTLCDLAEQYKDVLQVGRTHLQTTAPVPFGLTLSAYARRLVDRMVVCDIAFSGLQGKISGIVGTGASVSMVVGDRTAEFEKSVLEKLHLEPDYTATQIVQKEGLADVGHALVTLMGVLGDFANDIRILYSSEIKEVGSSDGARRLGGSSADAAKDNPINFENIAGKYVVVQRNMAVLYAMIQSDLQRDLRGSVQARYVPEMMAETYESFCRVNKAFETFCVLEENMQRNLQSFRDFPSEAMVAITRAHGYTHPTYGVGHDAVKKFSQQAKQERCGLLGIALEDQHFREFFETLPDIQRQILRGRAELYTGFSQSRIQENVRYAKNIISGETT